MTHHYMLPAQNQPLLMKPQGMLSHTTTSGSTKRLIPSQSAHSSYCLPSPAHRNTAGRRQKQKANRNSFPCQSAYQSMMTGCQLCMTSERNSQAHTLLCRLCLCSKMSPLCLPDNKYAYRLHKSFFRSELQDTR